MLSESDKDNEVLDRHRMDQTPVLPLPSSALRGNADADAKATFAESLSELQVLRPLLPDLVASFHRRLRTVVALKPFGFAFRLEPILQLLPCAFYDC